MGGGGGGREGTGGVVGGGERGGDEMSLGSQLASLATSWVLHCRHFWTAGNPWVICTLVRRENMAYLGTRGK